MGRSHGKRITHSRSAAIALMVLVAGLALAVIPQGMTLASSGLPGSPVGTLTGRVINTRTGSGLLAAISVIGPQRWAGGTSSQGYYSVRLSKGTYEVSVLKNGIVLASRTEVTILPNGTTTVNFQVAYTSPTEASTPPPPPPPSLTSLEPDPDVTEARQPTTMPAPDPSRRPQILTTAVGGSEPALTDGNVGAYAQRYDVLTHVIPSYLIPALRQWNPDIILLQYGFPHGTLSATAYPDSYYVKDAVTGSKVKTKRGWFLLDFRQPSVRLAALQNTLNRTPSGVDGYWLDMSGVELVNNPFISMSFFNSSDQVADLGNLDGGWRPSLSMSTKPDYIDAVWPHRMLDFHEEMLAAAPGPIRVYNGLQADLVYRRNAFWRDLEAALLRLNQGVAKEAIFVAGPGSPQGEGLWKSFLDRAERVIASGKIMHFYPITKSDSALQQFAFFSYLLLADGRYAWYAIQAYYYNSALYARDYGMPEGRYSVVSTTSGPLYKREFTNSWIWVNPGDVTRTAEGRSLGAKSAIVVWK